MCRRRSDLAPKVEVHLGQGNGRCLSWTVRMWWLSCPRWEKVEGHVGQW